MSDNLIDYNDDTHRDFSDMSGCDEKDYRNKIILTIQDVHNLKNLAKHYSFIRWDDADEVTNIERVHTGLIDLANRIQSVIGGESA